MILNFGERIAPGSPLDELTGQLIILCWIIFLSTWGISALQTKRTIKGKGWRWWNIIQWTTAIALYLLIHNGLLESFNEKLWAHNGFLDILSIIFAMGGLVTLLWSRYELGRNWSAQVVLKENHELVTTGPYAYVRHPIYSGILLLGLGTVLWLANSAAIIVFVILIFSFPSKAHAEEKLLINYFGERYSGYIKKTKAFIPFIF